MSGVIIIAFLGLTIAVGLVIAVVVNLAQAGTQDRAGGVTSLTNRGAAVLVVIAIIGAVVALMIWTLP